MNFLKLHDIYKTYEGAPLLKGVSFTVERGEIACLLGASGSGKTTLLRIIAGLESPEHGGIHLEDADITNVPTHRRGIVLMFQEYALFPHKTVAENVAFGLKVKRGKKHRTQVTTKHVLHMLDLVGLHGFEHRDVNELSGGERQRVALARSLAPHPRLLLLDEPLGALDRNLRERLLEELPGILRSVGVTAITVTHDQEEAFALADRVILLNEGQVVQHGSPESVFDHPASSWAARFLGLSNQFSATALPSQHVETPFGIAPLTTKLLTPTQGTILIHAWGIHLTLAPEKTTRSAHLHFEAQVVHRSFHGQQYHLTLRTPDGDLHLSRTANKRLPAVGETVSGWIDPAALRWLSPIP